MERAGKGGDESLPPSPSACLDSAEVLGKDVSLFSGSAHASGWERGLFLLGGQRNPPPHKPPSLCQNQGCISCPNSEPRRLKHQTLQKDMEPSLKTANSLLKKRFLGSFELAISSSRSLCLAALSGGNTDLVQSIQADPLTSSPVRSPPAGLACPVFSGDARNTGSIPESGRSPAGEYGNPLQYFCLENPRDRGALRATVHGVTKSQTRLK